MSDKKFSVNIPGRGLVQTHNPPPEEPAKAEEDKPVGTGIKEEETETEIKESENE